MSLERTIKEMLSGVKTAPVRAPVKSLERSIATKKYQSNRLHKLLQKKLYRIDEEVDGLLLEDKTLTNADLDAIATKINDNSNKRTTMQLIANALNRLARSKDDDVKGILLLSAALDLLNMAGDDESMIGLAKRIAYAGITVGKKK